MFFIDILLNHTAKNSEWLLEDENSYYNCSNTPQLSVAYELDKTF